MKKKAESYDSIGYDDSESRVWLQARQLEKDHEIVFANCTRYHALIHQTTVAPHLHRH